MVNVLLNGHSHLKLIVLCSYLKYPNLLLLFPSFYPKKNCLYPILKTSYVTVRIKDRIGILFLRTSNYLFIMYVIFCINVI